MVPARPAVPIPILWGVGCIMDETEAHIFSRLDSKVDKLIESVQAQNAILNEHTKRLETLGHELTILNEVQRSHGTAIELLAREVRHLQYGKNSDGEES